MKTINDIEFLLKKLVDKITNKFINKIKSDYDQFWGTNEENPYNSFVDMVETEFLAMGCDPYDYAYDMIDELLSLELGEDFEELDEVWKDSDHPAYYKISEYVYQRFIVPKLMEIVLKEGNNENN